MRVLALAVNIKDWMYDAFWREQQALAQAISDAGGEMIFYGPGFEYETNSVFEIVARLERDNWRPDLILCYLSELDLLYPLQKPFRERYKLEGEKARFPLGLDRIKEIPKVLWINDCWHLSPVQWDQALFGHGFSDVLATYCPPFLRKADFEKFYSPKARKHIHFNPLFRGIDPTIFRDYGEKRSVDVTLLGAIDKHFYPLRNFFHETLQAQSWLTYFYKPHPGYSFRVEGTLTGEAYARALARTKINVTCTTRLNLPIIKIGETLASGAMLMCDPPNGAEELGLVSGKTYVEVNREDFLIKLRYYLDHEEERLRIAEAGRRLFEERHSVENYAVRALNTLEKILHRPQINRLSSNQIKWEISRSDTRAKKIVRRIFGKASKMKECIRYAARVFRHGPPQLSASNVWESVEGGSKLDWKFVEETKHVLETANLCHLNDLNLIERYGLNAYWGDPPVITQHPEVVSLRPILLRELAHALSATTICEVGTARGLQSIFWARYFESENVTHARVFTCDIVSHDDPIYYTPITGEKRWTRKELWASESCTSLINFTHGDSAALAQVLQLKLSNKKAIDLAYIDGAHTEDNVKADYVNLKPFLSNHSVLVFDDCDPRFPGVEKSVTAIAKERKLKIRLVTFAPSPYCVAILGSPISLQKLAMA